MNFSLCTLLALIIVVHCSNSQTQSNASIYDVRFLLEDGSILENYYESGKSGMIKIACKTSTYLSNVELKINVLYSSSGSKTYKLLSHSKEASIQFKIPQDMVIGCYPSSNKFEMFYRRLVYKGRSSNDLPPRSLAIASSSVSDFDIKIARSPSRELYAGESVQVECSLSFLLPRQQLLMMTTDNEKNESISASSKVEDTEISNMKMTIKILKLFKTDIDVDETTFFCRAQDSIFKQIEKSINITIKFKQPITSVQIFSFCRAFTTKHMCVIESEEGFDASKIRWTRKQNAEEIYFNQTGLLLEIDRDHSIQRICCEVQLIVKSINFLGRNCREVQNSCFSQTIDKPVFDALLKNWTFTTQGRIGRMGLVQTHVIQKSGLYKVTLLGATGGAAGGAKNSIYCCKGAKVEAKIKFTRGQLLSIVVGQRGLNPSIEDYGGGGGGGSFVYSGDTLFAAAGGAGGQEVSYRNACNTLNLKNGRDAFEGGKGGLNGNGGTSTNEAGAGAGWLSDGVDDRFVSGKSKPSWTGGQGFEYCGDGGFGGGGGGHSNSGGGGGGYSGGGGSNNYAGGGGGSFCLDERSEYCSIKGSDNIFDGLVTIMGPI